jgi:hypothetical protein
MTNQQLTPRQQYEVAYCQLRLNGGVINPDAQPLIYNEIEDCAVLSYDNRRDCFRGWISRQRHKRFHAIKIRVLMGNEWSL